MYWMTHSGKELLSMCISPLFPPCCARYMLSEVWVETMPCANITLQNWWFGRQAVLWIDEVWVQLGPGGWHRAPGGSSLLPDSDWWASSPNRPLSGPGASWEWGPGTFGFGFGLTWLSHPCGPLCPVWLGMLQWHCHHSSGMRSDAKNCPDVAKHSLKLSQCPDVHSDQLLLEWYFFQQNYLIVFFFFFFFFHRCYHHHHHHHYYYHHHFLLHQYRHHQHHHLKMQAPFQPHSYPLKACRFPKMF